MQKNNQGFSLMIGVGLVIIMSLIAYLILSYMHGFSQIVSGVQDSSKAYYYASVGVEESLYHIRTRDESLTKEYADLHMPTSPLPVVSPQPQKVVFATQSSADQIPKEGFGQSEFDRDWNIISQLHPLQIAIGGKSQCKGGLCLPLPDDFTQNIEIRFRAPKLDQSANFSVTAPCQTPGIWSCSYADQLPILMWNLVAEDNSLSSDKTSEFNSYIYADSINKSGEETKFWNPSDQKGSLIEEISGGYTIKIADFYKNKCKGETQKCSLRISIVNEIYDNDNKLTFPYLEYQIKIGGGVILPDQYTHIRSVGTAGEFRRQLDLFIPQQTVPQAFDFTVIQ